MYLLRRKIFLIYFCSLIAFSNAETEGDFISEAFRTASQSKPETDLLYLIISPRMRFLYKGYRRPDFSANRYFRRYKYVKTFQFRPFLSRYSRKSNPSRNEKRIAVYTKTAGVDKRPYVSRFLAEIFSFSALFRIAAPALDFSSLNVDPAKIYQSREVSIANHLLIAVQPTIYSEETAGTDDGKKQDLGTLCAAADSYFSGLSLRRAGWQLTDKNTKEEICITPALRISGEQIEMTARAVYGKNVLTAAFTNFAPYTESPQLIRGMEQLKIFWKQNEPMMLRGEGDSAGIKNSKAVFETINVLEEQLLEWCVKNLYHRVSIGCSIPHTRIFVNGQFAGVFTNEPVTANLKKGQYRIAARRDGLETVFKDVIVKDQTDVLVEVPQDRFSVNVTFNIFGNGSRISAGPGRERRQLGKNTVFEEINSSHTEFRLFGYYGINRVPVQINSYHDRIINLLHNYETSFNEPGFWNTLTENAEISFSAQGLILKTHPETNTAANGGVWAGPFLMGDFRITSSVLKQGGGRLCFSLIEQDGRKFVIEIQPKHFLIVSEYEKEDPKTHILRKPQVPFVLIKKGEQISVEADGENGSFTAYQGKFPQVSQQRFFFGVDAPYADKTGSFIVPSFYFRHL